jgi:transposase
MKSKRRKFTREFKEEAVKLITEQGYKISEAARNLGVIAMYWDAGSVSLKEAEKTLLVYKADRLCRQS